MFSGYGGGISSLVINLIENKSKDFIFDTLAFSYKGGENFIKRLEKEGSHCYTMPRPRYEGYKVFNRFVNNIFSENQYDAIHCHISGLRAMPFKIISKRNKIKIFIIHAHTTRYDSKVDRILCSLNRYINYIIATDYFTCSDLAANYIFGKKYLKKRQAHLIPNGIKKDPFRIKLSEKKKEEYKKTFQIEDNKKILVHVGRFTWPKNHEFLLEIMKKANEQNKDFVLLMVGDGELYDYIKGVSTDLGLDNVVKFCGRRSDISGIMQFADCILLPSKNEGLPTVAIEAQAACTPIIISDFVTRQCDMEIGLVRFVSIESANLWVDSIVDFVNTAPKIHDAISLIEKKGFTSDSVGKSYCDLLKNRIDGLREIQ